MEQWKIAKQMIEFHKTSFDNTFNAVSILQEQTETMVNMFLAQAPWFPAEGKKVVYDWLKAYKKGRDDFKSAADESYRKVDEYFTNVDKEEKAKTGK